MKLLNSKIHIILLMGFIMPLKIFSQDRPQGSFLQDSIKVGEQAAYSFVFKHHGKEVVFPDSNYNFYPFEFVDKKYFPTRTVGSFTIDSAVYYLTTFEMDSLQPLGLPVFVFENGDSTTLFAQRDTIILNQTLLALPDSIALKSSSYFRNVYTAVNYPYILIGLGLFFALVLVVLVLFGKIIKQKYKLYLLNRDHKKFIQKVNYLLGQMNGNPSHQAGAIVLEWKRYLELLENQPFTKLTTKEIIKNNPDVSLEQALKSLDRSLYGKVQDGQMKERLIYLVDYSFARYKRKVEEVKHAK